MYSPSIELLASRIDEFNEQYAMVENEKAVFSIEYAEFHWNEGENAGVLSGNRYGLVRVARDLMLTAAAPERRESSRQCAARFVEGSDEIVVLKKRSSGQSTDRAQINGEEARGFDNNEVLYLENILESMNGVIHSFTEERAEAAMIEWNGFNRVVFITGTAFGLVRLAREFIQFALSASSEDTYEVAPLRQDGGRLVLVLRDAAEVSY